MSDNQHMLLDRVNVALDHWQPRGLVVAVSGGPDSVALLRACHELGLAPLVVAHINHQLRGLESDADEDFVRKCGQRWNLEVAVERVDTHTASQSGNLEAVARRLRYDALKSIGEERGIEAIATGHTLNDQAETVLFRLLRGSGLSGLSGIAPRRHWRGMSILRPMLRVNKAQVLDFLQQRGVEYRVDSSNAESRFSRNRLRQLLPLLEREAHPHLQDRLARLADQARAWKRFERWQADPILAAAELPRVGDLCIFDANRMAACDAEALRLVGRRMWQRERWPRGEMTAEHWQRFADIARGLIKAVDFPGGIRARHTGRVVRVGPGA